MSGRKQHYIPQFVLRSFGETEGAKKPQIRVTTRDREFLVPTDGVAAQREFYSKLDSEVVTLDDVITKRENEYHSIFKNLLDQNSGDSVDVMGVSRLLSHLASRGNYVRQSISTFGYYATDRIMKLFEDPENFKTSFGIGQSEIPERVRRSFDEKYNEKKSVLSKARIGRHDFRRMMFEELNRKWNELFFENLKVLKIIASMIDFNNLAAESHRDALNETIEPEKRVEGLSRFDWELVDFECPVLALPDCVGLGFGRQSGLMPIGFIGTDEITGAMFPLSPSRAVCAGVCASHTLLNQMSQNFVLYSSLCSWDFVVTPPSYPAGLVPQSRIGETLITVMYEKMEEAISAHLFNSIS